MFIYKYCGVHVDELGEYVDEENFLNKVSLASSGTETVLELYKASQVRLPEEDDDGNLENLHDWTFNFLKKQLRSKTILDKNLERKVKVVHELSSLVVSFFFFYVFFFSIFILLMKILGGIQLEELPWHIRCY